MDTFPTVDPTYAAWLHFRLGSFESAASTATEVLKMDSSSQLAWTIKLAALTEASKLLDEDHSQLASTELYADRAINTGTARPGTSLHAKPKQTTGFEPNGPQNRPQTGTRPLSGYARPGTSTRPTTGVAGAAPGT